ncbi:MAG: hypothetical protein ACRD4S_07500 [Candidatus Acidiferrales bacterium]
MGTQIPPRESNFCGSKDLGLRGESASISVTSQDAFLWFNIDIKTV